ncbi:hypothetical protein ASG19_18130 [Rhizobium sp. Leaf306]|nr:hypothetical protein ASG19_18130 [Rhizobium sp. Leaf306]
MPQVTRDLTPGFLGGQNRGEATVNGQFRRLATRRWRDDHLLHELAGYRYPGLLDTVLSG